MHFHIGRLELLAQIFIQKIMLDAINSSMRFNGHLFETDPNQNGTTNVVPDDSSLATLIAFNSRQLLGFCNHQAKAGR